MNITIETGDLDRIIQKIGSMPVKKALNTAIKKSIITLEGEAKIRTPVRTGLLRNSYETSFSDLEGRLRNFREYAPFVEARRHFIRDTLEENVNNIQDIFDKELDELLKSI